MRLLMTVYLLRLFSPADALEMKRRTLATKIHSSKWKALWLISITKVCAVAGLGGKVYRSGDYDYYINETVRNNDPKAVGPFILASLEWERLQDVKATVNQK